MTAQELRQKYLEFFKSKGHTIIPSASLVPSETDSSVLFTTAGMHPLVPYLLGEKHPGGKRVANVQKCVRTGDIDDVGDNRHLTFFEMLGNWSFGDYFKEKAINWSFEFLTGEEWLNIDPKRIFVTVFKGENDIPRDEDAIAIWKKTFSAAGLKAEIAGDDEIIKGDVRIIPLDADNNFWTAGATGPCGGDTEIFFDTRPEGGKLEGKFSDLVASGRLIEIWNDVFMEFSKNADGTVEKLKQKNVDTGMGVERTLAVLNNKENVFETELFQPIFEKIENFSGKKYKENEKAFRIIADHIKAAVFMIGDGVEPGNVMRGYVLRRLIRRAVRYGKLIGIEDNFTAKIAKVVIDMYGDFYKELKANNEKIYNELKKEENKFRQTLEKGMKEFEKVSTLIKKDGSIQGIISGSIVFNLYQTYGFPIELTREIAKERNLRIDEKGYEIYLELHKKKSRTASAGAFKGGLQGQNEQTMKLHTATHLLQAALREVLGPHVYQKGSNITSERLRFDFSHNEKLTPEQIKKVEDLVNEKIKENLPVVVDEMTVEAAKLKGALGVFDMKYGDWVKVYSVLNPDTTTDNAFSREICGGPHVDFTGKLGHFKILKEEAASAGVRRIKAIVD